MKLLPILVLTVAVLTTSCTTLQNRRYLWEPQKIEGPYTRMLATKPWPWPRSVQQADSSAAQNQPAKPWGK